MDDAILARLEHENMVATMSRAGSSLDRALVRHRDGVTVISTLIPVRLFNQVLISGPEATDEALRAAIVEVRARTTQWVANLRVGADDRFLPLVAELGLVPISADPWMPGMAMAPLPTAGTTDPDGDHEIRRVTDAAGLADHVNAGAEGFGMPAEWLAQVMGDGMLAAPDVAVYVGYLNGDPVTTGLGVVTERTIGVYNISTVPAARRRGYGAAMAMRIIEDGAAGGCDVAILQASEMGKPTYERLGFRTVVEYVGYTDPDTLVDA